VPELAALYAPFIAYCERGNLVEVVVLILPTKNCGSDILFISVEIAVLVGEFGFTMKCSFFANMSIAIIAMNDRKITNKKNIIENIIFCRAFVGILYGMKYNIHEKNDDGPLYGDLWTTS
jgi:hypothetical protein